MGGHGRSNENRAKLVRITQEVLVLYTVTSLAIGARAPQVFEKRLMAHTAQLT